MTARLLTGDCRQLLTTLPDASVQMCVTSPPYFGLRDYGVDGQIGLESTVESYVAQMVAVFREVRRVLRDDGTLWLNLGDSYAATTKGTGGTKASGLNARRDENGWLADERKSQPTREPTRMDMTGLKPKDLIGIPWRVAFALQADGWYLRSDIIWAKPNPMPESVRDRPTKSHEYIFLLTKSARYFWDAEAVAEAVTKTTVERLSQPTLGSQAGSDRVPGKTNGNMKAVAPRFGGNKYGDSDDEQHRTKSGNAYEIAANGKRNIRSVWTIATAPFAEAHFATFPPALAERCIKAGTSEKGACSACGAPWVRVIERGELAGEAVIQTTERPAAAVRDASATSMLRTNGRTWRESREIGWQPTCACDAPIAPCVVLDPFGGAGTVSLVAERLGRDSIYIDLSPTYAEMARNRIVGDAPLFASVS